MGGLLPPDLWPSSLSSIVASSSGIVRLCTQGGKGWEIVTQKTDSILANCNSPQSPLAWPRPPPHQMLCLSLLPQAWDEWYIHFGCPMSIRGIVLNSFNFVNVNCQAWWDGYIHLDSFHYFQFGRWSSSAIVVTTGFNQTKAARGVWPPVLGYQKISNLLTHQYHLTLWYSGMCLARGRVHGNICINLALVAICLVFEQVQVLSFGQQGDRDYKSCWIRSCHILPYWAHFLPVPGGFARRTRVCMHPSLVNSTKCISRRTWGIDGPYATNSNGSIACIRILNTSFQLPICARSDLTKYWNLQSWFIFNASLSTQKAFQNVYYVAVNRSQN